MVISLFDAKEECQVVVGLLSKEPINALSVSPYEYHQKAFGANKNMVQLTREVTELPMMCCAETYTITQAPRML